MPARDNQKEVKIFYLDEKQTWQPYAKATLHLDIRSNSYSLRISLHHKLQPHLFPILPATPLLQPKEDTIQIELDRITKVQKLEGLMMAIQIQEWNRVLAFSFKDQEYCDIINQQIQLSTSSRTALPCREEELIQYVAQQIENNPFFVQIFFNSEDVIAAFVKQAQKYEKEPESIHKRTVFRALKLLLLRADRPSLQILLKKQYYEQVLLGFSCSAQRDIVNYEFGDRIIHYHEEYRKSTSCSNVLGITDPNILEKYKQIIRIKFLIHVATSMFIEPPAEAVLNEILHQNSFALLHFLSENPECLAKSNDLSKQDPEAFIQLFSQLWEMFKSIMQDVNSVGVKRNFKDLFVSENIINTSFHTIRILTSQGKDNGRLYQQYLQALNPFLSHKWNQSQELLLFLFKQQQPHILELLLSILNIADYNTKNITLLFAKNLVQITQNRPRMKQTFLNYFFNEFVSKCVKYFTTTQQIQILVDFYMKLYRIDLVRTRRSIIESELLQKLEKGTDNKYILMLVMKMLRFFLEFKNEGIFQYLKRRNMFKALRLKYFQVKKYSPKGIIYSLFLGLLKDVHKTENVEGVQFIHDLMFPDSPLQ